MSLHGYQFLEYFNAMPHVKSCFRGVYSIDEIPSLKVRQFIVCNLSKKSEPGTHWFVIVRSEKKTYEIFNSLGFPNLNILSPHLKFRSKIEVQFNEEKFQMMATDTCGLFCIYFGVERCLNFDLNFTHLLEEIFTKNLEQNETNVSEFCNKLTMANSDSNVSIF